jgi:hypothetical protein
MLVGRTENIVYRCYGNLYYCKSFFTTHSHDTTFRCNTHSNNTLQCAHPLQSVTSYVCILG